MRSLVLGDEVEVREEDMSRAKKKKCSFTLCIFITHAIFDSVN